VTIATAVCGGIREALGSIPVTQIQSIEGGHCTLLRYQLRDLGAQTRVDLLDLLAPKSRATRWERSPHLCWYPHQACAQGRIITAPVSRAASVSRPGKTGLAARRLLEVAR
jgi:hypothetical protein